MQTHIPAQQQQTQQNQSRIEHKSQEPTHSQFEDARPEATAQLRAQALMAKSAQSTQLKSMQAMMAANTPTKNLGQSPGAINPISLQRMEDEEPLQAKADEPIQREQTEAPTETPPPKPNNTGLPDNLKAGIENLSGISMDHVKVHYNSDKPAQLQAHAYAQGSEIHVAPGQEQHLPHEAWHVVQQAQGRVRPTVQVDEMNIENSNSHPGINSSESSARLIQRKVFQDRNKKKAKEMLTWYSDFNPFVFFATKEEAMAAEVGFREAFHEGSAKEKSEARSASRKRKREEQKIKMDKDFADYILPSSEHGRLYKNDDKECDDVDMTELTPKNAKKFIERAFAERRSSEEFPSRVITLGGFHQVLTRGTDIGLTPARYRPDKQDVSEGRTPLSRDGKAKPYTELAGSMDKIAEKYSEQDKKDIKSIRERMGKDLDRFTRGSSAQGEIKYTGEELSEMHELAAVLRLDKGRVPGATTYIRETMTSGKYTFQQLFVSLKYAGAGKGGVKKLRDEVGDNPEPDSEGSDLEDMEPPKKKKKLDNPQSSMSPSSIGEYEIYSQDMHGYGEEYKEAYEEGLLEENLHEENQYEDDEYGDDFYDGSENDEQSSLWAEVDGDIFTFNKITYNALDPNIRSGGECLWDTLRHYGVDEQDLVDAANNAHLTFNDYVDDQDIGALINEINALGYDLQISLCVMNYDGEILLDDSRCGNGNKVLYIGLFSDPDGNGHYVPGE